MSGLGRGLERIALDLHVHTPASHDWTGGQITPDEFVAHARSTGLAGFAVTDHETGTWIDPLREAAKGTGLIVIPGVELNNLAGNAGIHLVVLFELDASSMDVERFLAAVGAVRGSGGKLERGTARSGLLEVLDKLKGYGAIGILAHCQSSSGALGSMRGEIRTQLVRHQAMLAAEAHAEDFFDSARKANHRRTVDVLDGNDPTYKRRLAVYQASDNPTPGGHGHSLPTVGSRFSYFYVEQPLTLESLRQCLIDPDVRIEIPPVGAALETHPPIAACPTLMDLKVHGGFLDDLVLNFHSGLNTVLGAKGSGKSLLVELLRFALNQAPVQPDVQKDHSTKLLHRLKPFGTVELTFRDRTGTLHQLTREFNPAMDNPITGVTFDPAEFFPCHFLSQGEIIRMAESEADQIRFIDSFFDFRRFRREIETLKGEIAGLDGQVASQVRSRKQGGVLRKQLGTLNAQIAERDKALASEVFGRYRTAQAKKQNLDSVATALLGLRDVVANSRVAVDAVPDPPPPDEAVSSDPLIKRSLLRFTNSRVLASTQLKAAQDALDKSIEEQAKDAKQWQQQLDAVSAEYSAEVQKIGGDAPALHQDRARLVKDANLVATRLQAGEQRSAQLTPTFNRREELLAGLAELHSQYSRARQERCEWFANKSGGRIRAKVEAGSNVADFRERLGTIKKGSYLSAIEVDSLAATVTPERFVRVLMRYSLLAKPGELQEIADASGLSLDRTQRLADFLLEGEDYESLLALQHSATPADRPELELRLEDGSYAPLSELSTGQKCTVFLIIALCEGDYPVIVDQPEDSLDIRSIWDDMCTRVRSAKRDRQFIFTTHNSSLAVASDSDLFIVMLAADGVGKVAMTGAIDSEQVRREVVSLLEGGSGTYFLKQRKYNLEDTSHD